MANIGSLNATIGIDTAALIIGEKKAVAAFNAIAASAESTTSSIAAMNAQWASMSGSAAPTHNINSFLREAGEGAERAAQGFSRADVKAALLGARFTELPPVLGNVVTSLAFGSAGIAALSVGIGVLIQQIADSDSWFRKWIRNHSEAAEMIDRHRESLDKFAASSLKHSDIAREVSGLDRVFLAQQKEKLEAELEGIQQAMKGTVPSSAIRTDYKAWFDRMNAIKAEVTSSLSEVNEKLKLFSNEQEFDGAFKQTEKAFESLMRAIDKRLAEMGPEIDAQEEKFRQFIALMSGNALAGLADTSNLGFTPADLVQAVRTDALVTFPTTEMSHLYDETEGRLRQLTQEAALIKEVLATDNISRAAMVANAIRLQDISLQAIDLERQHMEELGISAETAASVTSARTMAVMRETKMMLMDSRDDLRGWAYDLSAELNAAFDNALFAALKGKFEYFYDYLLAITDVFTRSLTKKIADAIISEDGLGGVLGKLISGGVGGHVLGSQIGTSGPMSPIPAMASGGIVSGPTFAVIGEAGPEAVIPLGKLRDPAFWESVGGDAHGERPINVQFNITTPDVQSFRRSQSQIMTDAAVALQRAQRNM